MAYTDRLFRPFLVVCVVLVVGVQLILSPDGDAAFVSWLLFVPTALLAIWTITRYVEAVPVWLQTTLFCLYSILASALFPIPADTFSAAFVFMAAASAGQLLSSYRLAVLVAVVDGVACAVANYISDFADPTPWPWWLGLLVGLPVYIGITRRQRNDALKVAELAAFEMERAAASEAREAALLERGRIAREIHDVLGHSLSAIAIQLDMAQVLQAHDRTDDADAAIHRARDLARTGIGETRRAVHALNEDQLPVSDTLQAVTDDYAATFMLIGQPTTMAVEKSQTIIRATQESLTNAHRHAPGSVATVTLDFSTAGSCRLEVENGAPAFAPRRADIELEGSSMGLASMEKRVRDIGGECQFRTTPEGGWIVRLAIPT
ncbi:hypothetical protein AX769_03870 [Frondihabitans sp. PAMC 28766]|nr:hypothetical protein AX769_03870 [Frondihabitans sp. PAMC 28766]